ncbi:RHS repeat protein [Salmonella enterica subsp. enterica]|nr:RHS repeat protein [Salmonella enterica subsp. enterica]
MTTISACTPVITVLDNRGVVVRTLNWNRTTAGEEATLLVTRTLAADDTLTVTTRDPRLFTAWQTDDATGANLTTFSSLAGQSLRRDSTDSGQDIILYDAEGRPAWSRDPAGTVMTWAYDERGRPTSVQQQPAGATETVSAAAFIYGDSDPQTVNPQGNNLRGVCVRQYDEGGLLSTGSVALSGAVLSTLQTFLRNAEALPDWPDDEAGRSALLESTGYTTTVQADALGRVTTQTDASGHAVSIAYDVSGVPVTQSLQLKGQTAMTLLTGMTLSAAGQVLSETAGNGVTTTYSYMEDTLRLSGIAAVRTSDNTVLQSLGYVYDPAGNVTMVTDATVARAWFRNQATDGSRTFTYDALYQLTGVTGRENATNGAQTSALPVMQSLSDNLYVNYTRNYTYDASGNLTLMTHAGAVSSTMTMVTDSQSNRSVRQNNSGSLTPETVVWADWFTPGGQLKTLQTEGGKAAGGYTDSADPLAWDRNTRLQAVTLVNRSSTDATRNDREVYQYRGGMRVRKQTRKNTSGSLWTVNEVRYLPGLELRSTWQETVTGDSTSAPSYSEQLEVVTTQAGRCQIRALHWVTTPPGGISNNQVRYGVDDNIGSMQLELDNSGQVISREEYYPYGGTAVWAARSQTEADYKTVRYSGQERDGTGLYYYGYRYYAPWLCRWTAPDPGREVDGLNLFRMVDNNPVSMRDIAGLAPIVLRDFSHETHTNVSESLGEEIPGTVVAEYIMVPDNEIHLRNLTYNTMWTVKDWLRYGAGNQLNDIFANEGIPVNNVNNIRDMNLDTRDTALATLAAGTGLCDEYSKVSLHLLYSHQSQKPSFLAHIPGHTFALLGDHRVEDPLLVDSWVTIPTVLKYSESVYSHISPPLIDKALPPAVIKDPAEELSIEQLENMAQLVRENMIPMPVDLADISLSLHLNEEVSPWLFRQTSATSNSNRIFINSENNDTPVNVPARFSDRIERGFLVSNTWAVRPFGQRMGVIT